MVLASLRPLRGIYRRLEEQKSKRNLDTLSFAKVLASREINSLHTFLNPPICYDCSPCSASSGWGLGLLAGCFRSHRTLLLENLALRHQLTVLKRRHPKPKLSPLDKLFWVSARRFWSAWKSSLIIVTPETVVRWHRAGFRRYWSLISRVKERVGRKKLSRRSGISSSKW